MEKEEVEKIIDELANVAIESITHVAIANYPEREREAIKRLYAKIKELKSKLDSQNIVRS